MTTVDSKGRIVLPQAVRERLGITAGTEVAIREEDGKAVVEPEDAPEQIIERMDQLVAETSPERRESTPLDDGVDPIARKHRDAVRSGAENDDFERFDAFDTEVILSPAEFRELNRFLGE